MTAKEYLDKYRELAAKRMAQDGAFLPEIFMNAKKMSLKTDKESVKASRKKLAV